MVPVLLAVAAVALISAQTAYALSAHSPQDLFAYPQYRVTLSQDAVLNQTVVDQLSFVSDQRERVWVYPVPADPPHCPPHSLTQNQTPSCTS